MGDRVEAHSEHDGATSEMASSFKDLLGAIRQAAQQEPRVEVKALGNF